MTINFIFTLFCLNDVSILIFSDVNVNFLERSFLRFWGWSWCFFLNYFFINVSNFLSFISYKFTFFRISFIRVGWIFFRVLSFNKCKSFFIYFTSSVFITLITRNFFYNSISAYNFAIFIFSDIDVSFFEITLFNFWIFNCLFIYISYCLVFIANKFTFSRITFV